MQEKKNKNQLFDSKKEQIFEMVFLIVFLLNKGQIFQGFSSVRCVYDISRKEIIRRVNDDENFPDWQFIQKVFEEFSDLPEKVYLVQNKVFNSQRSICRHPDFELLSRTAIQNRLNSKNFPEWRGITKQEFIELQQKNPLIVFEFMWQRSNDHPFQE